MNKGRIYLALFLVLVFSAFAFLMVQIRSMEYTESDVITASPGWRYFSGYQSNKKNKPTSTPTPSPTISPTISPTPTPTSTSTARLQWGAYLGDAPDNISSFESLTGKKIDILADFEGWSNDFPLHYKTNVGQAGKTLVVFWEPSFGYDKIISGSYDSYIAKFASDAKLYSYPVILVPFDEMNLNESAWGYGANNNTATKFVTAWKRIKGLFSSATNVKFAIAYNNVSIPNISGNTFDDYYPGSDYVDYVGVDGFNFGNPWQDFGTVFDSSINQLQKYNKPIYIFSTATIPGTLKPQWIIDGLGSRVKTYPNMKGWIWFNTNTDRNWLVNTDTASLDAFKSVIPQ